MIVRCRASQPLKHTGDFNAVELQSIRATEHQSYRAKVVLQSIMNISHDCAQQSFTVVKTNFLVLGSITVMLQSIVYIFHDCANQIIMVVLQSSLHTVIELVNQRVALLEKDKGSSRSVWFAYRQRPATWPSYCYRASLSCHRASYIFPMIVRGRSSWSCYRANQRVLCSWCKPSDCS